MPRHPKFEAGQANFDLINHKSPTKAKLDIGFVPWTSWMILIGVFPIILIKKKLALKSTSQI